MTNLQPNKSRTPEHRSVMPVSTIETKESKEAQSLASRKEKYISDSKALNDIVALLRLVNHKPFNS